MPALKPNQRRHAFDELTSGWGAYSLDDLIALQQLLNDMFTELGGWTMAEQKVVSAIEARIATLRAGGK